MLNEKSDRRCAYHFPVYDINEELSNLVFIRNLPPSYPSSAFKDMIERVCKVVSVSQQRSVYRIKLRTTHRAMKMVEELNGHKFYGKKLSVSQGQKNWILGLFYLFLSSSILSSFLSFLILYLHSLFSFSSFSIHH